MLIQSVSLSRRQEQHYRCSKGRLPAWQDNAYNFIYFLNFIFLKGHRKGIGHTSIAITGFEKEFFIRPLAYIFGSGGNG